MRICLQNKRHQAKIPDLQCENYFQKPISSFVLEVEHQIVAVPKLENTWDQFLRSRIGIPRIGVDLPLMTGKNVMPSLSKNVKIRGFPFHLRHIPFKLSVFHSWKSIKNSESKVLISSPHELETKPWLRDMHAGTWTHARNAWEENWKCERLGSFRFSPAPKKPLRWTPNFASMHPLQSDRLCVCNWAVHAPATGGNWMGKQNKRRLTFRTAWSLQQNVSHLC